MHTRWIQARICQLQDGCSRARRFKCAAKIEQPAKQSEEGVILEKKGNKIRRYAT
jgi:hypothetical protein